MSRTSYWTLSSIVFFLSILGVNGNDEECGLYLAETWNDEGARTMGVFTAIERPAGSLVGYPDVVLPLVDVSIHNNSPNQEEEEEEPEGNEDDLMNEFSWLFDHFVWDSHDVGGSQEGADVKSVVLGLGSLTQGSKKQHSNVFLLQSHYDSGNLHRSRDPAAGAISYYPGSAVVSLRRLQAGEELYFHQDSHHWYLDPQDQEQAIINSLPSDNDQVKAFWRRYEELQQRQGEALKPELRSQLWSLVNETPLDSLSGSSTGRTLFPIHWGLEDNSYATSSTNTKDTTTKKTRSPEWLRQHGLCMDHLIQGPSKIKQAGRGAFATRHIARDALIAPAPVVHIVDKSVLTNYHPHIDETLQTKLSDTIIGKQLLLNYCFGHRESSKLLCPIGSSTGFINHSPNPNAAVRWSNHYSHQKDWLNLTLEELGSKLEVGLVLEYYALRDIGEDEEITIHYGPEWEEAWKNHVKGWSKPPDSDNYISAEDMNSEDHAIIRTLEEQNKDPYPHSVMTSCYFEYIHDDNDASTIVNESNDAQSSQSTNTRPTIVTKPFLGLDASVPDYVFLRPCRILERNPHSHDYTVEILNPHYHIHDDQVIPDSIRLYVRHFPRDAIVFTDFPYSTDQNLPQAFRHEMMLPEHVFPPAWRNQRPAHRPM
jgi:SET domain